MTLRCVYCDLDGTLLGRGASLLHDGEGRFTLLGVRALEACARAEVEVVLYSGRRRAQVNEDARLLGQRAGALRVADVRTGRPIGGWRAFERHLAKLLSLIPLGLGFLWMLWDPRRQTWHDKIAGTVVVRHRPGEPVAP